MKQIQAELNKIAKLLQAGDSSIKKVVELLKEHDELDYNDYDTDSGEYRRLLTKIVEDISKLKKGFKSDYIDFIVGYLKKEKTEDPTMVFLGSLQHRVDDALSKKYGIKFPGLLHTYNNILSRKDQFGSMKPFFKRAYDKVYGKGVWEQALKNQ